MTRIDLAGTKPVNGATNGTRGWLLAGALGMHVIHLAGKSTAIDRTN
jgi:hypothetical protein